jgi:hypothetical protein
MSRRVQAPFGARAATREDYAVRPGRALALRVRMTARMSILVSLGACTTSPEAPSTLPNDTYFIYDRVDECVAREPNVWSCGFAIALCSNGRAGERIGDIVQDGDYTLDPPFARGAIAGRPFELDLQTGDATGLGASRYIPDQDGRWQTLQFDTIDCSR